MIHFDRLWTLLFATVLSFAVNAEEIPDIRLGDPTYGGSGCPAGTAAIALSPDARSFSIVLTDFVSQVYELESRRIQRRACSIAIPVYVPEGFRVRPNVLQIAGNYDVTHNNRAQISVEAFFAGSMGPAFVHDFQSEDAYGSFVLESPATAPDASPWSRCGQSTILRFNINLLAIARETYGRSVISVDQIHPGGDIFDALLYEPCTR